MVSVYDEKFVLRNSDFSFKDKLKPQAMLELFEEIAGRHATKLNIGYEDLKKLKYAWVVVRTKVKIYSDLKNGSNAIVRTFPSKRGKIDFDRNYQLLSEDGSVAVDAMSKWIVINYETRRISRASEINYDETNLPEPLFDSLEKVVIDKDLNLSKPLKFNLNDLDHNGHVNNCRYVEKIFDTFDYDIKDMDSFECEYVKEMHYLEEGTIKYDDLKENYQIFNKDNELSFTMKIKWR